MKILTIALLSGIIAACTSNQVEKKDAQIPVIAKKLTIIVLGNGDVFFDNKVIPVASLSDKISLKHTNDSTGVNIELSDFVTTGDVFHVTKALQKASFQRITVSEDLSLNILQLELTGNGEVSINNGPQISLSALHSHLSSLDRSRKIMAFLFAKEQTPAEDVFFAQRMLAKNHIKTTMQK